MAEVRLIPCLSDNYAVLVHVGGTTVLVDAPEAGPIRAALDAEGWRLDAVLITHHHPDHVGALPEVRDGATVLGPAADAHRIPGLDVPLDDGAVVDVGAMTVHVLATPGHTSGHVSYTLPAEGLAFTADTLFVMGCGRLFEGDAATLWGSLLKLRETVEDETLVYCGHEYTLTNARYAHAVLPDDPAIAERLRVVEAARARGAPTVPTTMAAEKATNPFLRADEPALAVALGMPGADPVEVFAHLRRGRDRFT